MSEMILHVSIGIFIGSTFSLLVGYVLQRCKDREDRMGKARFDVYMKLLQLYELYFGVTCDELHKTKTRDDRRELIYKVSWSIANKLREYDNIECFEEIMQIIFSESEYKTAKDRYDFMGKVIDRLGDKINPNYNKIITKISDKNLAAMPTSRQQTAPINVSAFNFDIRVIDKQRSDSHD